MLSIEHLYFSYQGQPPYVLNDLNLHIHSGDYISIVGDNGCGKSTLLRLILGFLTPVKGSIKRDTNNIRYVSQKNDFSHAGFPITVKEILDSYRKLLKIKDKHEVDRVLELTNMTAFTLEALVNPAAKKNNSILSTIMGIEGKFLVRLGDDYLSWNQIQVVWDSGSYDYYGRPVEGKLSNINMTINANEWSHIAVTFGEKTIKVYVNGVEKGSSTTNVPSSVNFGIAHNDEQGTRITRCFWVGYSYEHARYFPGMMSELRIWNRVLTADELANATRRYGVDPKSEGLVTYWKCDEGQGDVIKDHTSYRNDLASDGLKWEPVSLP